MSISIIAAMGKNRVIGKNNKLPWPRHTADMVHFRELTICKPVIMGRKTYESVGGLLRERMNIVISKDALYRISEIYYHKFKKEGFITATSLEQALKFAEIFGDAEEIMVIGGASIYRQFLPIADKIYLTIVNTKLEGDTFFPRYSPDEWRVESIKVKYADKYNPYALSFVEILRIRF